VDILLFRTLNVESLTKPEEPGRAIILWPAERFHSAD